METSALPASLPPEVIWAVIPDTELKDVPRDHIFTSTLLYMPHLFFHLPSQFSCSHPLLLAIAIPFHTMYSCLSLSDSENIMTSDNYRMLMLFEEKCGFWSQYLLFWGGIGSPITSGEGHEIVEWLQFKTTTVFFIQCLKSNILHCNMNYFPSKIPIDPM